MALREVYLVNYDEMQNHNHHAGRCKMDLHADTCVASVNCLVLEYTGQAAEVG